MVQGLLFVLSIAALTDSESEREQEHGKMQGTFSKIAPKSSNSVNLVYSQGVNSDRRAFCSHAPVSKARYPPSGPRKTFFGHAQGISRAVSAAQLLCPVSADTHMEKPSRL